MKLPRRPPSLAALAVIPVLALVSARGSGQRATRAEDASEDAALLAYARAADLGPAQGDKRAARFGAVGPRDGVRAPSTQPYRF